VSHKKRFRGESVGLNIDIGSGYRLQEAGLSNIGISTDQEGPCVGVYAGQTPKVLSHLLEVYQRIFQSLTDCGHPAQSRPLERLALEQGLCIFQKSDIVSRHRLNESFGRRQRAQSDLEVVGIVEGIEQIFVEGVNVL
jgi:hypothetical protein